MGHVAQPEALVRGLNVVEPVPMALSPPGMGDQVSIK